jgi:hypothetical protein
LPAASFRFHLTVDTLAVKLTVPPVGSVEVFHLLVGAPCRAHTKEQVEPMKTLPVVILYDIGADSQCIRYWVLTGLYWLGKFKVVRGTATAVREKNPLPYLSPHTARPGTPWSDLKLSVNGFNIKPVLPTVAAIPETVPSSSEVLFFVITNVADVSSDPSAATQA